MPTSAMQDQITSLVYRDFGTFTIKENHRPDWLSTDLGERLEIDLFIAELEIGFEIQGEQHFYFSKFFHKDMAGFSEQLRRDREKIEICNRLGVILCEVCSVEDYTDFTAAFNATKNIIARSKQYKYSPRVEVIKSSVQIRELRRAMDKTERKLVNCDPSDIERVLRLKRKRTKQNRMMLAAQAKISGVMQIAPKNMLDSMRAAINQPPPV